MPDTDPFSEMLDDEYQRREAERVTMASKSPMMSQDKGYLDVDPMEFARDTAAKLLEAYPDAPDSDLEAIKAWADRRVAVNKVRQETRAKAGKMPASGFVDEAVASVAAPFAMAASDAMLGIPEKIARKAILPAVGASQGTPEQVADVIESGRQANPTLSYFSQAAGSMTGAMPVMKAGTALLAPAFLKAGLSSGMATTAAGLVAGAAHGGATTGTVSGAVESGLFMGGTMGLGRVLKGAAPSAGRYLAAEGAAGGTASLLAQMVTEGHADPVKALADGVVNAVFGIGGARAAGRARAAEAEAIRARAVAHVQAQIAAGRELADIVRDQDFAAMAKSAGNLRPGEGGEMLAEAERGVSPDLVAENEMLAGSRTPEIAPETDLSIPADSPATPTTKASEKAIRKAGMGDSRTRDWQYEGERFAPKGDLPDATKSPKRWVDEFAPPVEPDIAPPPEPEPLVPPGMERMGAPDSVGKAPPDWSEGFAGERPVPPEIPTEPAPRPGKAGERGAVDVSGLATGAAKGVRSVLGTETQKIRDLDTPSARELADLLEQADDVRQERSGPITPARRKVEIFASRPGGHGAARSLTKPDIVRSTVDGETVVYALPRGEQIINGKVKARTPEEAQLVQLIEDYWQERGKGFEAVGTKRIDPKTGEPVDFKTPKGVWPRVPHQDGIDLILRGDKDKAWKPFVRAVADANKIPVEAAGKILGKMRDRMLGISGVTGPETGRVSEAEVFRELKHMPSDIYVRGNLGGTRRISILETDATTMVRRATDMGTSRMGVIKALGQDMGEGSRIDDLRRRFISENAGRGIDPTAVWDKAIRMAHAIPKNDAVISPSSPLAPAVRGLKSFFNLVKTARMSNRWASNVFEWTGAPREFVGLANQAKVQWQRVRDVFSSKEGKQAVARDLERRGAIIDEGLALPADPSHPFSHAANVSKQILDTVTLGRPMESSQEHGFARGADMRLKEMQARKGKGETHAGERDVLRLMQIGVPEAQARKLAYGEGTQAEYDTALRTSMNKVIGANTSQLSRSPLENSRIGKLLWYNSWASMNLRHSARTMLATIRGVESAFAPGLTPDARVRRLGAATRTFLSWAAGRTVSNAAATAMVSFITGGPTGLSANLSAAKDDLGGFLTKSFLYGIVGGPYAAIIRNADENLSKQIQGVATPIAVVTDMADAIMGRGRYTDKHGLDRLKEIVRTYIPFTKSVFAAKAMVTGDTMKLDNDAAESAYFEWRRESDLYKKSADYEREPSDFRAAVWKITDLVEAGKMDEARAEYEKAQSLKPSKNTTLAKSIMDQRLLNISDMKRNAVDETNPAEALELMKALRQNIGDTAYRELEKRDARIMEFLGSIGEGR